MKLVETLGARVRRLRLALNLKQGDLASLVPGMSASAISQLENNLTKEPKGKNLVALAKALQTNADDLLDGTVGPVNPFVGGVPLVPIIGFAIATPEDDGYFSDGDYPGEGYIPWPTRDPNAYALRVKGDSMQPRIRPGELIIVEPNVRVSPGDDVVVRTISGRRMVKQLLLQRAGEITLGSINQAHQQTTISLVDVESMQFVCAIVPRGASVHEISSSEDE